MIKSKKQYLDYLDQNLCTDINTEISALDLFSGCGGLSLGFESVGISTNGFDANQQAVKTYNNNLKGKAGFVKLNLQNEYENCNILIAGPPCQPYSRAGKGLGQKDLRDGIPIVLDALQKTTPQVIIIENVVGLKRNTIYFEDTISELKTLGYTVNYNILNAKNYGVPQNRERIFIIGVRNKRPFQFPEKLKFIVTAGQAIGFIRSSSPKETKILTNRIDDYILKYEKASKCKTPRDLHLNKPSRTITCRNLSGSTGDMMRIRLKNGSRRTLSIKEAATLQSFPSWYKFSGSNQEVLKQIGNAVPPLLSKAIAKELVLQYFS